MATKYAPCNVCEGRGSYWQDAEDGAKVTCKRCNGTGKVELPELPRPAMFEDDDEYGVDRDHDYWGV